MANIEQLDYAGSLNVNITSVVYVGSGWDQMALFAKI